MTQLLEEKTKIKIRRRLSVAEVNPAGSKKNLPAVTTITKEIEILKKIRLKEVKSIAHMKV